MQLTQRGGNFAVFDDFLDDTALAELRTVMAHSKFSTAESSLLTADDGAALRSRSTVIRSGSDRSIAGDPKAYGVVLGRIGTESALFGQMDDDWNKVGFTFWNYPAGSRLGWHSDSGGGRRGSYILFLHEEWRASWGGELLILDEEFTEPHEPGETASVEAWVGQSTLSPLAVLPRPNRLVFLKAGTPHQVNRVDPTAALVRCSLTGHVTKKSENAGAEARDSLRLFVSSLTEVS
ncbi:2OG-Fe(II) oxygenase [Streptacidiphilus melanogenes]|uniref:2OG-Fe(II) oxygenase n=1 Tax=Streptacidiphilus melanogenes TaxID=411235 RepID=UPI0005A6103E|nr:2OG-Fe(II) oxygenase [Streptacidiphilus melanogenes]